MNLITQAEIIESVQVDRNFSVNNISNDTIQKAELYLAAVFLGNDFFDDLLQSKTGDGVFSNSDFQVFYDRYLRRLISEYVLFMGVDEMVLRLANNGLNNEDQISALKYAKESLKSEVERSKAMAKAYLINYKGKFPKFLDNLSTDPSTEKTKKISLFGFIREDALDDQNSFLNHEKYLI